jgi:hypothetical protein
VVYRPLHSGLVEHRAARGKAATEEGDVSEEVGSRKPEVRTFAIIRECPVSGNQLFQRMLHDPHHGDRTGPTGDELAVVAE